MNIDLLKDKIKDFITFLDVEKNSSEHTLRAYEGDLRQFILFWDRIIKKEKNVIFSFDKVIRRYVVSLFYQKISKATLARKLSCLRSFHQFLKTVGIKLNFNFKSPRPDKKLPSTLSVDEVFYLLDTIKNDDLPTKYPCRDKAVFELIYATGARCSELVQIKISDIDFTHKVIRVLGKGKKERLVLFGEKAKKSIKNYFRRYYWYSC